MRNLTIRAIATMIALAATAGRGEAGDAITQPSWQWETAAPHAQGMLQTKLEAAWDNLLKRHTTAFLVIRNDKIVFERYAPGFSRTRPHYTALLAQALVGGVSLMLAMNDKRQA